MKESFSLLIFYIIKNSSPITSHSVKNCSTNDPNNPHFLILLLKPHQIEKESHPTIV